MGLTAAAQGIIKHIGSLGPLDFDTNLALRIVGYTLPTVASFTLFALLYRYVPTARPRWNEALAGATFATILFELMKNFYALIFSLTAFSKDSAIYAGFGNALGFLLWLFVNASILLLGAEFARAASRRRAMRVAEVADAAAAQMGAVPPPAATPPSRRAV